MYIVALIIPKCQDFMPKSSEANMKFCIKNENADGNVVLGLKMVLSWRYKRQQVYIAIILFDVI